MQTPEIITDRLVLSPLAPVDAETLFEYRSLPEVSRFQNWEPTSTNEAVLFIERLARVEFDTPDTWYQFGIRLRESDPLIGDFGMHFMDDGCQVEIGFTLAPAYQHRGLGAEAVVGVLDFLFTQLRKHRVFASVDPRNRPSLRLLRRIGMRQEAHYHKSLRFKDEWADDVVFAVLASEWVDRPGIGGHAD